MRRAAVVATIFLLTRAASPGAVSFRFYGAARAGVSSFRESLFNPGNLAVEFLGWRRGPLSSLAATAEIESDALSLHWRLDLQGSAVQGESGAWRRELRIGQLFLQKDLSERWVLAVGRSIQRWGTGYVFNPTDVAAPERELGDPDNTERRAVGLDMIKLERFSATSSLAFCLLARMETRGRWRLTSPRLALRFYKNAWDTDLSLVALFSREETPVVGLNGSRVFGERLEIHGEFAIQKNSYRPYHAALVESRPESGGDSFLDFKKDDGRLYVQGLLGFQYTFPGGILWVAEYYHRGQGYSLSEWRTLIGHVRGMNAGLAGPEAGPALEGILAGLAAYAPRGTMRDYLVNYLQNLGTGVVEWRIGWLLNLADMGGVWFPEFRLAFRNGFTFFLRSYIFLGRGTSEFGAFPRSRVLEGGLRFRL
ncbi:MAG: hypothetical protein MUQ00_04705 [Candidatus Aminicenantes bacterium]|nr:hypothetical protein [Candidatus Aminicenantes bacterium]